MERTTISVPDGFRKKLRMIAAERGVSVATLVREALEEKIESARPKPRSLGLGASGYTDTARRSADELPDPPAWR